jgi:hypothetical protein
MYLIRSGPSEYKSRPRSVFRKEARYDAIVKTVSIRDRAATVDWALESTRTQTDADGERGPKGAKHRLTRRESVRDTWVWQEGWKLRNTPTLSITLDAGGKPVRYIPRAGLFIPPLTAPVFDL